MNNNSYKMKNKIIMIKNNKRQVKKVVYLTFYLYQSLINKCNKKKIKALFLNY